MTPTQQKKTQDAFIAMVCDVAKRISNIDVDLDQYGQLVVENDLIRLDLRILNKDRANKWGFDVDFYIKEENQINLVSRYEFLINEYSAVAMTLNGFGCLIGGLLGEFAPSEQFKKNSEEIENILFEASERIQATNEH